MRAMVSMWLTDCFLGNVAGILNLKNLKHSFGICILHITVNTILARMRKDFVDGIASELDATRQQAITWNSVGQIPRC